MAHGPLEKLTQINTKQHVGFLLYQCDEGTCFFANLFKENEQFTRVRLKSHIAVSFSETNTAAATHQVFTFKPSAKKLDPFCYCTFSIIRRLHAKGAIALMWHQIASCGIINAYVACKVSWQIVFVKLIGRKVAWKLNFTQNFFFRIVVLIFLEGASRSQKICLADPKRTADPSLRTTGTEDIVSSPTYITSSTETRVLCCLFSKYNEKQQNVITKSNCDSPSSINLPHFRKCFKI